MFSEYINVKIKYIFVIYIIYIYNVQEEDQGIPSTSTDTQGLGNTNSGTASLTADVACLFLINCKAEFEPTLLEFLNTHPQSVMSIIKCDDSNTALVNGGREVIVSPAVNTTNTTPDQEIKDIFADLESFCKRNLTDENNNSSDHESALDTFLFNGGLPIEDIEEHLCRSMGPVNQ